MSEFVTTPNPLLKALSDRYQLGIAFDVKGVPIGVPDSGGKKISLAQFQEFVNDALRDNSNLERLMPNGSVGQASIRILYERQTGGVFNQIHANSLMSRIGSDAVTIDQTKLGQLLFRSNISNFVEGIESFHIDRLGRILSEAFSGVRSVRNTIIHPPEQASIPEGYAAENASIVRDVELPKILETARLSDTINGITKKQLLDATAGITDAAVRRHVQYSMVSQAYWDACRRFEPRVLTSDARDPITGRRIGGALDVSADWVRALVGRDMPLAGLEPSLIQAGQLTKDIAVIEQSRWKNIAEIALGDPDKFNSSKEMYFQGNDTEFENMVRKTVDIITESAKHSIKFVDEPISNISQLMRKALEIASQAGSEAESATIALIKKIASWQKSFLTIVPEILDNLPEQLVKTAKFVAEFYKNAWDDTAGLLKFSGSAGKYALKLTGAAVGALLAGLDGVAEYKKAGGFTAEFFEWAAKAAATALIAIPVVGSLASFAMATSPIWGTAGVVAFVAAGTYFSIRLVAENLADAFKDEPNSFIYKASSGVLEAMKYLEGAAGTVLEQAASFFVSSAQAKEVSPGLDKIKVDTVHISGAGAAVHSDNKDNAWLFGSHDGVIIGGEADDWLIHTGYGEALGDKGDDVLLGLFSQILKKGEKIGDPPPKDTPDTRKTAEDDLSLTLDGGEGNDWVISIGGEGAKTIGGLGRDWIYNRTNGGVIYGDSESGIYEKPVIGADGQPVLNADGTPKTIPTQVEDSEENSDNIWYAPNTVVKDAQHHDVLKFYGLTLTGGDANGGIAGFALFGGVGAGIGLGNFYNSLDKSGKYDWARSIYFDHLFPWMTYAFRPNKEFGGMDMYITNQFDLLFNAVFGGEPNEAYKKQLELDAKGIRNGFMKIEHADVVGSPWGAQHGELAEQGTFNMVFRSVNILSILGPILSAFGAIGGLVAAMGMADGVLSLAVAAERFLQGAKWSSGADPLVIDLDGDGIETKELALSQVYFDIDNDLFGERTGWLSGDDGFLVRDVNRNGRIDNITEMFGGPGRSGFGDLRALDSNGDGQITRADLLWAELKVWQDKNSDGLTDAGEVKTLDQLGIVTLDLGATAINITTSQGARLTAFGDATFADGRTRRVYDAVLSANDSDTRYAGEAGRAAWQGAGPDLKGFGLIANLAIAMANDPDFAALTQRVAGAMTTPDLRVLVAQAREVLGAWGESLERTRELTPDNDNAVAMAA
jgi:hypothetical protein